MTFDKISIWLKIAMITTFVSGAFIFLYPFISNVINTQVDIKRIKDFEKMTQEEEKIQLQKKKEIEENLKKNPSLGITMEEDLFDSVKTNSSLNSEELKKHIIGSISIPKINSHLPIFDETNASFLQEGITLLPGASYPTGGLGTHSVLTGHTGLPNKKLFTDLKELIIGDIFYVTAFDETLAYKVDQIKTVLPDQLDDLNKVDNKDYTTLITCTPYMINTHRLLVRGHQVPIDKEVIKREEKQINKENKKQLYTYILSILILISLFIIVLYRQYINYQIFKNKYQLSLTILYDNIPQTNISLKLVNHGNKKTKRIITNKKGQIKIKKLQGNSYFIIGEIDNKEVLVIKCWVKHYKNKEFNFKVLTSKDEKWGIKLRRKSKKL